MMRWKGYSILGWMALLMWTGHIGSAQIISSIKISTDSCLIGDIVEGEVYVKVPEAAVFEGLDFTSWLSIPNKLYFKDTTKYDATCDVEILDFGAWVANEKDDIVPARQISLVKEQGYITFTNKIKFAIYSQGRFELPGAHLIVKDSAMQLIDSQGPVLEVFNPDRVMANDTLQINPIKDIITEPRSWTDYAYLLWIIPIVLGLWYAYKKWKSRPIKPVEVKQEVKPTPTQKALAALDVLKAEQPWKQGREVEYQTALTDIIRSFIKEQHSIPATEMTTVEILSKMRSSGLTSSQVGNLNQILNIADLIKFAKVRAGEDVHESFLDKAYSFIKNDVQS